MNGHTKKCNCCAVLCDECSSINDAIRYDHFDCLKKYIHQNPRLLNNFEEFQSPLALAIGKNNFKFVKFLLESGTYVDLICSGTAPICNGKFINFEKWIDFNALELAIYNEYTAIIPETKERFTKIIDILKQFTSIETIESSNQKIKNFLDNK